MKSKKLYKTGSFMKMTVLMLTLLFLTVAMEAMAWQRNVSRSGPQGRSSSRNIATNRTGNGYSRNTTMTGPQGNTATRSAQGQWDPETKTWTKNVAITGESQ